MIGLEQPVAPAGPPAESQYQPTIATSPKDCVPNVTRKGIRRGSLDAKAPSTAAVRAASGAPSTRGLTYGEAAEAAEHFGVTLVPSYGNDRQETVELIDAGHAAGGSIDCSITVNTERATNSYTGDHTVYLHDVRHVVVGGTCLCEKKSSAKAHNEFLIEDPGNSSKGYQWWSSDLFYRAAEARTRDKNGISHGINLLVTPDTEDVTWKVTSVTALRKTPSLDAPSLRSLPAGTKVQGGRTETGGAWPRPSVDGGGSGTAWLHGKVGTQWGWIQGRKVARAA